MQVPSPHLNWFSLQFPDWCDVVSVDGDVVDGVQIRLHVFENEMSSIETSPIGPIDLFASIMICQFVFVSIFKIASIHAYSCSDDMVLRRVSVGVPSSWR